MDDINRVLVQGIDINGITIDFRLKAIVADTPTRAFIKGKNDTISNLIVRNENFKAKQKVTANLLYIFRSNVFSWTRSMYKVQNSWQP